MVRRLNLAILGGGLLVAAGLALIIPRTTPNPIRLPDRLGGLVQIEAKLGSAAEAEVQRLHRRPIDLASAAFARYGRNGEATLWVAGAAGEDGAAGLLEAMQRAMEDSGSPFTPLAARVISGVTVFPLRGMGQEHALFRSGRLIVWLAADPAVAEVAVRAAVEAYR